MLRPFAQGGKIMARRERAKINPRQPITQRLYSIPTEIISRRYFGAADAFQRIAFGELSGRTNYELRSFSCSHTLIRD